ncbi:MAG: CHAT domain-containing protein [Hassallia sp.]
MSQIKILFLAADPSDESRLRLLQELRDIKEKLRLANERDRFVLESRESVRVGDITQALFDFDPQIVHFSGHGTSAGELYFEDLLGKAQPVQADALGNLFELVADKINCVVLNACYSETQAKVIAEHIPFVIGMNQAIGDKAAIAFAVGFYKALAAGKTIEKAYKFGCVEIQLQGIAEHLKPVIYKKSGFVQDMRLLEQNELGTANYRPSPPAANLTSGQRRRISEEIDSLKPQYELLTEKIKRFRQDLAIEASTDVKFKLENHIERTEAERKQLAQRIENLEDSLE